MTNYREDPWEFEHSARRLNGHERSWVAMIREDEQPHYRPPVEIVVCPQCGGRGTSSLYLGAISGDTFAEDPDFADEYFAGAYDRTCETCGGRNVIEQIDPERLEPELRSSYETWMREAYIDDAVRRQEFMMGA